MFNAKMGPKYGIVVASSRAVADDRASVENCAGIAAWCKFLKIAYPRLCLFAFLELSLESGAVFCAPPKKCTTLQSQVHCFRNVALAAAWCYFFQRAPRSMSETMLLRMTVQLWKIVLGMMHGANF